MDFPTLSDVTGWVTNTDPNLEPALEFAHKMQLFYIFQAGTLAQNMAAQLKVSHTQAQLDSYQTFLQQINKSFVDWLDNESAFENANSNLPKLNLNGGDIFTASGISKIKAVLNTWSDDKDGISGLGFIPLIIGAVAGLLALWGVYEISKRFTTTVQDKEDLLAQTAKTIQDLKLSPTDAAALLVSTQAQTPTDTGAGGISSILKYGLLGLAAIFILPQILPKSKS
jgi:hypothetical protein